MDSGLDIMVESRVIGWQSGLDQGLEAAVGGASSIARSGGGDDVITIWRSVWFPHEVPIIVVVAFDAFPLNGGIRRQILDDARPRWVDIRVQLNRIRDIPATQLWDVADHKHALARRGRAVGAYKVDRGLSRGGSQRKDEGVGGGDGLNTGFGLDEIIARVPPAAASCIEQRLGRVLRERRAIERDRRRLLILDRQRHDVVAAGWSTRVRARGSCNRDRFAGAAGLLLRDHGGAKSACLVAGGLSIVFIQREVG